MKYRMAKFFQGRNGNDSLARLLLWTGVAVYVLAIAAMMYVDDTASSILFAAALVLIVMSLWRTLSRNLEKRRAENQRFLSWKNGIKTGFKNRGTRFKQRREYRFFKCPDCKSILRVPRGKGRVQITCRRCGARFTKRT